MGIHSRYGLAKADQLKKLNTKSHCQIFSKIFNVDNVEPNIFFPEFDIDLYGSDIVNKKLIGINAFAGGRWKSKQLDSNQLEQLVKELVTDDSFVEYGVVLIGQGDDFQENKALIDRNNYSSDKIVAADTSSSLFELINLIGKLNILISSDSLAMHLAIAQKVKTVAFFSPTSAVEIDGFGVCEKIQSRLSDYCSYKSDSDNSDITADRILVKLKAIIG